MNEKKSNHNIEDENLNIKNQMELMVDSYDLYMKRITLGREDKLRSMTVNLAQVKPGDSVLKPGGRLMVLEISQAPFRVFGLPILLFARGIK